MVNVILTRVLGAIYFLHYSIRVFANTGSIYMVDTVTPEIGPSHRYILRYLVPVTGPGS